MKNFKKLASLVQRPPIRGAVVFSTDGVGGWFEIFQKLRKKLDRRSNSYLGGPICVACAQFRQKLSERVAKSLHFLHIMSTARAASTRQGEGNNENSRNIRRSAPPGGAEQDKNKKHRNARTATEIELMKDVPVDVTLTKEQKAMIRSVVTNHVFPLYKNFNTSKDLKTKCPGAIAMCFKKMKLDTTSTTHSLARLRCAATVMDALKKALSDHRLKLNRAIKAHNLGKLCHEQ